MGPAQSLRRRRRKHRIQGRQILPSSFLVGANEHQTSVVEEQDLREGRVSKQNPVEIDGMRLCRVAARNDPELPIPHARSQASRVKPDRPHHERDQEGDAETGLLEDQEEQQPYDHVQPFATTTTTTTPATTTTTAGEPAPAARTGERFTDPD